MTLLLQFSDTAVTLLLQSCDSAMTLLSQSCDNVVTVLGECCDIVVAVLKKCYDTPLQNCDTFLNPWDTAASPLLHCLVVLGHCCYIPMT